MPKIRRASGAPGTLFGGFGLVQVELQDEARKKMNWREGKADRRRPCGCCCCWLVGWLVVVVVVVVVVVFL